MEKAHSIPIKNLNYFESNVWAVSEQDGPSLYNEPCGHWLCKKVVGKCSKPLHSDSFREVTMLLPTVLLKYFVLCVCVAIP